MRSGVIAQKVGMTRVFTEAGEHVPVTVLKLDGCQVVAQRTMEKNGYTAVQLGIGRAKVKNVSKAERTRFAAASVEPKMKLAEFRVKEEELLPIGAEITADHFVVGQFVDVTGTSTGKGFAGPMKRWGFGGLRATAWRLDFASFAWFDRRPSGPGQDLQEQENGRPYGRRARHHAKSAGGADRPGDRGLLLVEGAVPGTAGGWIFVRDAVKRALPKDAPQPGKFRLGDGQGEAANSDAAPQEEKKED